MDGINFVDIGAVLIILISAILAFSRGVSRESLSIAGWVGSAIAAYLLAPRFAPLVSEIPILSDIIGSNCELGILASFAIVFAIILVIASIFTPLFSNAIANSALGPIDKGLGLIFGVLRGAFLVAIGLFLYNQFVTDKSDFQMVEDSKTKEIFAGTETTIEKNIPENAPGWFSARYQNLIGECEIDQNDETPPTEG